MKSPVKDLKSTKTDSIMLNLFNDAGNNCTTSNLVKAISVRCCRLR